MYQRYRIFFLFILILNYSCIHTEKEKNMTSTTKTETGNPAPAFSLPDQDGKLISLADFAGKSNVVLFFYPKDESYGCTKEACSFRDSYEDFRDAGAEVIGISPDDEASHRAFAAHHKLPFHLLTDKGGVLAKKYGIGKSLGFLPGRVTFVIDKQGIIRKIFSSQIQFEKHSEEAIEELKRLK
jgi:peroxiredoxin Q/BCP